MEGPNMVSRDLVPMMHDRAKSARRKAARPCGSGRNRPQLGRALPPSVSPQKQTSQKRESLSAKGPKSGHCGKFKGQPVENGFYLIIPQAMRAPPPPKGAGWSE
jgi:hypothetical protein